MKKIAFVLFTDRISGAEKIIIEIIEQIKDRYDCTYVCHPGEIEEVLKEKDIKCKTFSGNKELIELIKTGDYDIVHANDYKASLVASASGKKVLSHIHHNKIEMTKISKLSILYALASFKLAKVVCVSKSIRDEMFFKGLIKNKTEIKYNWLNAKERTWEQEEEKDIDILFVGRFEEAKNPKLFVDTIKEIVEKFNENLKVCMIGRGSLKESTIEYIKSNSLEKNIEILDFTDAPHKYMKKSKVFFVPSRWEGFGLVFLEAIANDSAVVATPVGGIKEIFEDYQEFLGNEKNEFVEKIISLLQDDVYRDKVIKQNKSILARFDMKNNIDSLAKLYDEL